MMDFREIPNGFFVEISYSIQKTTLDIFTNKVPDRVPDNQQKIPELIKTSIYLL